MSETDLHSPASISPDAASLRGDDAYERIRRDLLACGFMPGSTLTEHQLMECYTLGKSSCRVALVRLAHEGYLRPMPRQGYRVAPITLRDVEEVFALRVQLEPLAARLACGRVDTALLRRLEAAHRVRYPERALDNQIGVFLDANREFHLTIAQASGNERLHRMLSNLMDEMSRLVALGFGVQRTKPEIKHDHTSMIDAFDAGDRRRAETIVRRHIETFRDMTMEKVYASLSHAGASLPVPGLEIRRWLCDGLAMAAYRSNARRDADRLCTRLAARGHPGCVAGRIARIRAFRVSAAGRLAGNAESRARSDHSGLVRVWQRVENRTRRAGLFLSAVRQYGERP